MQYLAVNGYYGKGDIDALVARRIESVRNPTGESFEDHTPDGRWFRIRRRRATGGGTVTVMTDITRQKQAERELLEAKQRTEEANKLITEKNRELELLARELRDKNRQVEEQAAELAEWNRTLEARVAAQGPATNLAARLCGEAKDRQILIAPRVLAKIEGLVEVEALGEFMLKGFHRAVPAYNVLSLSQEAPTKPILANEDGAASVALPSVTSTQAR